VDARLKAEVRQRSRARCEYCQSPEAFAELRFQVDHIIPQQHGGPTASANLAWSCLRCNKHKGPNLSGIDPATGQVVRLFHPRRDRWAEHFA
jgi:5-methylcytosine-specific restriction endonuclease McrA